MTNQSAFLLVTVPFGLYCLLFTTHATKMIALFTQLSAKLQFSSVSARQSVARPLFIRLIGIVNLGMAAAVYFGWLGAA